MKVKGAGMGYHMGDAYAYHEGNDVMFYAWLRTGDGLAVHVYAPKLTPKQAKEWVMRRYEAFHEMPGAREGTELSVQRKVIMAHGQPFVDRLMAALDKHGKMELEMMVSPDAHSGLANKEDLKGKPIGMLVVNPDGSVIGLSTVGLSETGDSDYAQMRRGYEE